MSERCRSRWFARPHEYVPEVAFREDLRPEAWELDGSRRIFRNIRWAWQEVNRCKHCGSIGDIRWRDDLPAPSFVWDSSKSNEP